MLMYAKEELYIICTRLITKNIEICMKTFKKYALKI